MMQIKLGISRKLSNGELVSPAIQGDYPDSADPVEVMREMRAKLEQVLTGQVPPTFNTHSGGGSSTPVSQQAMPRAQEAKTEPPATSSSVSVDLANWQRRTAQCAKLPELSALFGEFQEQAKAAGWTEEQRKKIVQVFSLRKLALNNPA